MKLDFDAGTQTRRFYFGNAPAPGAPSLAVVASAAHSPGHKREMFEATHEGFVEKIGGLRGWEVGRMVVKHLALPIGGIELGEVVGWGYQWYHEFRTIPYLLSKIDRRDPMNHPISFYVEHG